MNVLQSDTEKAAHRGTYEVSINITEEIVDPYLDAHFEVSFTRPDGTTVTVDSFYDGDETYKARAYCDQIGDWSWSLLDNESEVKSGTFEVHPSPLPGKLRVHPADPRRLCYDDGSWFLHIGDTGYRYPTDTENGWQTYLDDAVAAGVTKIRTWFSTSRHGIEGVFENGNRESGRLALDWWQEMDRRYRYALETYPHVQFQIIPYGEDGEALRAYPEDELVQQVGAEVQARLSAFPNVYWCIANDVKVVDGAVDPEIVEAGARAQEGVSYDTIDLIGRDFAAREPWETLLTSHQLRQTGFSFRGEPWPDIITLHDLDQGAGERVSEYVHKGNAPVVLDEDRYEHYREPDDPAYFFRRLFWANLLAGGHPTYGGNRTYELYDGERQGMRGYVESDLIGLDHARWIHSFFANIDGSLVGMRPDQGLVEHATDIICAHDTSRYLLYLANPDRDEVKHASVSEDPATASITISPGRYSVRWFNPRTGEWVDGKDTAGGLVELAAPGGHDWVVLLEQRMASERPS